MELYRITTILRKNVIIRVNIDTLRFETSTNRMK